jgi:hypothetical protein
VDGDVFDEAERPALQPLTDWRIVVSPPLVIENTLPIAGSYIVWELPKVSIVFRVAYAAPDTHLKIRLARHMLTI